MITAAPMKLRRFVLPQIEDAKEGCVWCPLGVYSADFPIWKDDFQRDPEKITKALRGETHVVRNRNARVAEWSEVDILFVSDGISEAEDKEGLPMSGSSEGLLKRTIAYAFKDKVTWATTTLVRCRTPFGRDPNKTEIVSCSPDLAREIAARKPKLVIPMGNAALEYFLSRRGITTASGCLAETTRPELKGLWVLPCIHPSYVHRNEAELSRFIEAIEKAGKAISRIKAGTQVAERKTQCEIVDTLDKLDDMLRTLRKQGIRNGRRIAFDTETGVLSPHDTSYPQLLCFSFSYRNFHAYVVPFDHKESPWSLWPKPFIEDAPLFPEKAPRSPDKYKSEKGKAKAIAALEDWNRRLSEHRDNWHRKALADWKTHNARARRERPIVKMKMRSLFANPAYKWDGQNFKFDYQHILKALDVRIAGEIWDTMAIHAIIDERPGTHGLDNIAIQFTPLGRYDHALNVYKKAHPECDPDSTGGSYANFPGYGLLFQYAGADTDATRQARRNMMNHDEFKSNPLFRTLACVFLPKLARTLAEMEYRGAQTDLKDFARLCDAAYKVRDNLAKEIASLPLVQQYEASKIRELIESGDEAEAAAFRFNPGSDKQLGELLWNYGGMRPVELTEKGFDILRKRFQRLSARNPGLEFSDVVSKAVDRKEWWAFSTKSDVLHEYKHNGDKLSSLVLDFRTQDKLIGTYYEPMPRKVDSLGRIHGYFHLLGAISGRLSSSDPNLQNISTPVKSAYISRFTGQPREERRLRWKRFRSWLNTPNRDPVIEPVRRKLRRRMLTLKKRTQGVLGVADYSQIELRVAASMYRDPIMIETYERGEDLHLKTTLVISGLTEAQYKKLDEEKQEWWRRIAKAMNFGIVYGIGATGIVVAQRKKGIFIPIDKVQQFLSKFKDSRSVLFDNMRKHVEKITRNGGKLITYTGRVRRLDDLTSRDDELKARAGRQAVNIPVQGGASDMTLMALCVIADRLQEQGLETVPVLTVHDSIITDGPEYERDVVATIVLDTMRNIVKYSEAVFPGLNWKWLRVPIDADMKFAKNWREAKGQKWSEEQIGVFPEAKAKVAA